MGSPTKAANHFKNIKWDASKNRNTMECIHCRKVLNDHKNSTGKVNHLLRCNEFAKTGLVLANKVKGMSVVKPSIQVQIRPEAICEAETPSTPFKSNSESSNTPIKSFLLSGTPY